MADETDNPHFVRSIVDDDYLAFENELALDNLYDFPHSIATDFNDETNNASEEMIGSADGQTEDASDDDFRIDVVDTYEIFDFTEDECIGVRNSRYSCRR